VAVKIPGDLIGTWAKDNGLGLNVALVLGANSNVLTATAGAWQTGAYFTTETSQNYAASATGFLALQDNAVYVTGVQLEKGTLVTPFEFRPDAVELPLCQRYYYKVSATYYSYAIFAVGNVNSPTLGVVYSKHPVTMRVAPIHTYSTLRLTDQGSEPAVTSLGTLSTAEAIHINVSASGGAMTGGKGCLLTANGSTKAYLDSSAEL
jgi:hypothetical protein